MRVGLVVLSSLVLSGCPASQDGTEWAPEAVRGPTPGDDPANVCTDLSSCEITFQYIGNASTVELRGDFRADGWAVGEPLSKTDGTFSVSIPITDGRDVHYKFVVDGQWITDPENPRTASDGWGGANSVVSVSCDECSAPPYDWRDAIMYFVFVDRFLDGNTNNNQSVPNAPSTTDYAGGDLAGVMQKLQEGYFEELGVDVLWLTAPFDNGDTAELGDDGFLYSAYHGYWPKDLDAVESRLGTLDEMTALVEEAHSRGIKVVLDYVMNHVHESSPLYAEHPDWFWPLEKPDGGQCVCGDGCDWGGADGLRCWFRSYLPDFNFQNPDARAWSVKNAIDWIDRTGVDGYRLDAVKHIEDRWIRDLREQLRIHVEREHETFYLVGETFDGSADLIGSYVDPDTMLDGQFDFPMRAQLARVLLRRDGSMFDLDGFLSGNDTQYHPGAVMGTFIGNHDLPRSIHLAEDTPVFGEWDSGKWKAWFDLPELPTTSAPYERLLNSYAFLMTTPGVPLIYYGDEYAMPGGGDPDNRRPMQWTGHNMHQLDFKNQLAVLTHLRREHAVLRRGTRTTLGVTHDTMTYQMADGSDTLYMAINRGDGHQTAVGIPSGTYTDLITGDTINAPVDLGPRQYRILEAN